MSYDVFTKDGRSAGTLSVERRGPRTVFEYSSDLDPGVSRLVLLTPSGPFSLGIPTPRAGGLYLSRTMSRLELGGLELTGDVRALLAPAEEELSKLAYPEAAKPPEAAALPEAAAPPKAAAPAEIPQTAEAPEAGAEREPSRWQPEAEPGRHFSDPELAEEAAGITGAMVKYEDGAVLLAFPWSPSQPFPMVSAFRQGAPAQIGDRRYIVFRLADGRIL